jgi:hypothetical protein
VHLPLEVELRIARVARRFFRHARRPLVVTSGTRSPRSQAIAMYRKLRRGQNLLGLYRKTRLAREVVRTWRRARRSRRPPRAIVEALTGTLQAQMRRGDYLSAHLRNGAVDVRSRTMTRRRKRIFRWAVEQVEGVTLVKEERRPPHFHLEVLVDRRRPRR